MRVSKTWTLGKGFEKKPSCLLQTRFVFKEAGTCPVLF